MNRREAFATAQAGSNGFDIKGSSMHAQFICQLWCPIALFSWTEGIMNGAVTVLPEPLSVIYYVAPFFLGIPDDTGSPDHPIHGFDAELSLVIFDKDMLYFSRKDIVNKQLL